LIHLTFERDIDAGGELDELNHIRGTDSERHVSHPGPRLSAGKAGEASEHAMENGNGNGERTEVVSHEQAPKVRAVGLRWELSEPLGRADPYSRRADKWTVAQQGLRTALSLP
jgi:hypothetical protein